MSIDPSELEDLDKAGLVLRRLSKDPSIIGRLRREAGLPPDGPQSADSAAMSLHFVVRAAEKYGRRVGAQSFEAALSALIDDSELGIRHAREALRDAIAGRPITRTLNPYSPPNLSAGE